MNSGAMMVQTLIPNCSPAASKTEEILSRYRPIAPKPELPPSSSSGGGDGGAAVAAEEANSQKMRHSPYLRNIWAHLQARPTRTRKRGRNSITPTLLKRHHHRPPSTPFLGLCCPPPPPSYLQGFKQNMITLPLLSSSSSSPPTTPAEIISCMDLNSCCCGLEEKDLVLQLQSPTIPWSAPHVVIAPKAVRPIGSTIKVGPISMEGSPLREAGSTRQEEVEVEAEAESLPVLITDSKNRVRMANSAYKELVGQPECRWLDELMGVTGRRISGEVVLQLPASVSELPGFSCWTRIEWGKKKKDVFCDVVRLNCETKLGYLFSWRFHTITGLKV